MNEIVIYITVALITSVICSFYAVFCFTKIIIDQQNAERELNDKIEEVKMLCGY